MSAQLVYIPENGYGYYANKYVRAVFAGNMPNRCRQCVFSRYDLAVCYGIACKDSEREDGKNVYFENYEKQ